MRLPTFFIAAMGCALATPAIASAPTLDDLGVDIGEAGQASYFAVFACGIPPSQVDTMKMQMEHLSPGSTRSAAFMDGLVRATRAVQESRETSTPDDSELTAGKCPEVVALMTALKKSQGE